MQSIPEKHLTSQKSSKHIKNSHFPKNHLNGPQTHKKEVCAGDTQKRRI